MVNTKSNEFRSRKAGKVNRGDRARFLFEHGKVHPVHGGRIYEVESETKPDVRYRVTISRDRSGSEFYGCRCPDYRRAIDQHQNWDHQCKHIGAVILYKKAIRESWKVA